LPVQHSVQAEKSIDAVRENMDRHGKETKSRSSWII
jgi:hypothetical protein